jgi:hypothetical protein
LISTPVEQAALTEVPGILDSKMKARLAAADSPQKSATGPANKHSKADGRRDPEGKHWPLLVPPRGHETVIA